MRKRGKLCLWLEKVWARLTPVTNSLTKLDFHVDVDFFIVGHHVGHNVVSMLCDGSETMTEWKSESTYEWTV